jgi:hypothetical protein
VFTSDMHRDTLEQNSRLVDDNERLHRQLSALQNENLVLKQNAAPVLKRSESSSSGGVRSPVSVGIKTTSAFIGSDGKVPGACPLGGCSHYETVLRGNDTMKNFQNHMNNTHRVCDYCTLHHLFIFKCIDAFCITSARRASALSPLPRASTRRRAPSMNRPANGNRPLIRPAGRSVRLFRLYGCYMTLGAYLGLVIL